jgi:anthranilate phosphoribosyltransferase
VFEVTPADAGLAPAKLSDLKGGDARHNAAAIRDVLSGKTGPFRDIVMLNAAAALLVGGKVGSLSAGVEAGSAAIASGRAKAALDRLIAISNG